MCRSADFLVVVLIKYLVLIALVAIASIAFAASMRNSDTAKPAAAAPEPLSSSHPPPAGLLALCSLPNHRWLLHFEL